MTRFLVPVALVLALLSGATATFADDSRRESYRSGPAVKGYAERRGGYSYNYSDSVNTYGDSRSLYGGASAYRDPMLDRQTNAGPFDHGFFFFFFIGSRGGDFPYMN